MSLRHLLAVPFFALAALTVRADAAPAPGWNFTVNQNPDGGHVLGNPQAVVKLTEYVSYTCPHCAHFQAEADGTLHLSYVGSGKVSVEVKHMLRDPIDLAVALLTNCGTKDKFFGNHDAFMRRQQQWIQPLMTATAAQRGRWVTGDNVTRLRAIADDFGLYAIMDSRGYTRPALDHCLADKAEADRLAAQTDAAGKLGVDSTPSFTINGVLLAGTHSWDTLEPQIKVRL